MNTQELAKRLNQKEVQNIIGGWEKNGEAKKLADFNSLVRLGDSEALAVATVLNDSRKNDNAVYKAAYES